ncbi:MAG: (Fe-S)-binding protein [Candidatus Eremiobacteraeota bacterium]|nr:(Fe-S)-binding protein [Candidatus Eremiobacteraeota bacterium]
MKKNSPPFRPFASQDAMPALAGPSEAGVPGLGHFDAGDLVRCFLEEFKALLFRSRALRHAMDACVRCGACAEKCHGYIGTGDPRNMPVARAELLRGIYRGALGSPGRVSAFVSRDRAPDPGLMSLLFTYFHQCTLCRRCAFYCPFGIDTSEVTIAVRQCLAAAGVSSAFIAARALRTLERGNSENLAPADIARIAGELASEIKAEKGVEAKMPVDVKGAGVLLIPPARDLVEHRATMKGYALVFHRAGISWTLSSGACDALNMGMFLGYPSMKAIDGRIWRHVRELEVKEVVVGESGEGFRAISLYSDTMNGPLGELLTKPPSSICSFTADLVERGALRLDRSANKSLRVTLHDPCHMARAAGHLEEVRFLVRSAVPYFVEMAPGTIKERSFCCGGGGGLLAPELSGFREKSALPRMEALRDSGATFLAAPCATCRTAFREVLPRYQEKEGFFSAPVSAGGIHELIYNAL